MKAPKLISFFFTLLLVSSFALAQDFAVSYPPNLKELKINPNEPYKFKITIINNMNEPLEISVETSGDNVIIDSPSSLYLNGKKKLEVPITLTAPKNTSKAEFSALIRFSVVVKGEGGKIAGDISVPVKGVWTEMVSCVNCNSHTTSMSNENVGDETQGSQDQNMQETQSNEDPITSLLKKYTSEKAETTNENPNNEVITIGGSGEEQQTKEETTLTQTPITTPTGHSSNNILLYFVIAAVAGVGLAKVVSNRRGGEDEDEFESDYDSAYYNDYSTHNY